jgi:hypothetical protein
MVWEMSVMAWHEESGSILVVMKGGIVAAAGTKVDEVFSCVVGLSVTV